MTSVSDDDEEGVVVLPQVVQRPGIFCKSELRSHRYQQKAASLSHVTADRRRRAAAAEMQRHHAADAERSAAAQRQAEAHARQLEEKQKAEVRVGVVVLGMCSGD